MPLKSEAPEEPALNMTPMIDVVFLLIIFFMVGTQFAQQESGFEVQIPNVSAAPALTGGPDPITINVLENGEIRVGDQPHTLPELLAALERARENFADQAVLVRGDGDARHQRVMDVMAVCHEARVRTVKQAVRVEEDSR